jgi:hypothetical protein
MRHAPLAFALLILAPASVVATPITYSIIGTVAGAGVYAPAIPAGTPISIAFSYDTDAPNECGSIPNKGIYSATGVSVTFLGSTTAASGDLYSNTTVPGGCGPLSDSPFAVFFNLGPNGFPPIVLPDGTHLAFPPFWYIFGLHALTPGGIPLFNSTVELISNEMNGGTPPGTTNFIEGSARATVVPEPSTVTLLAVGIVALLWLSRATT